MSERIARLRAHQNNIDRYEGLLRSTLSAVELRFVEQRLSEERLALMMLQCMSPSNYPRSMIFPIRDISADPKPPRSCHHSFGRCQCAGSDNL
jgi:hypothetical protein